MPYYVGATFIVVLITLFAGLILWQEAKQRQQQSQMMMQNATTLLSHHIEGIFNEADTLLQAVSFHYRDQLLMENLIPNGLMIIYSWLYLGPLSSATSVFLMPKGFIVSGLIRRNRLICLSANISLFYETSRLDPLRMECFFRTNFYEIEPTMGAGIGAKSRSS